MSVTVRRSAGPAEIDRLDVENPERWSTAWWRALDDGFDDPPGRWFVAERDGVPAGWAAGVPIAFGTGGRGVGVVWVPPAHRCSGVGAALRQAVEGVSREAGLPGVMYQHDLADRDAVAAVSAWGLVELARHQESVLDLESLDVDVYQRVVDRPGCDLRLVNTDALDDEAWGRLHAFVAERWADAPDADGADPLPVEVLRASVTGPGLLALASEGDHWVGVTAVMPRGAGGDVVNTFFTGVVPEARGRGVAAGLKAFHALALADRGVERVVTQNMEGNEPILAANRSLGFEPSRAYADVAADWDPQEAAG